MGKKKERKPEENKIERALTTVEKQSIDELKAKKIPGRDLFRVTKEGEYETLLAAPLLKNDLEKGDAYDEFHAQVYAATGCTNHGVGLKIVFDASNALMVDPSNTELSVNCLNRMSFAMRSLEPKDSIEGQLAAQMVVLQEQSMMWLTKALRTERVDFANTYINAASKLMVRHHEALATLMKYRRRGEQHVYVEHVHVNEGGRAIVGNVSNGSNVPTGV